MFTDDHDILETCIRGVDYDFNSIFFGNILNAILTGITSAIAYSFLNIFAPAGVHIPVSALVGLFAGVVNLIPVADIEFVYIPIVGYMGLEVTIVSPPGLWFVLPFAAVSFVIADTIPDLVFRPYVSGRNLHVGTVMLVYMFGLLFSGWYDIPLMPMIPVLFMSFARLVLLELSAGKPIRPYTVDPARLVDGSPVEELTTDEVDDTQQESTEAEQPSEGELDVPKMLTGRDETRSG